MGCCATGQRGNRLVGLYHSVYGTAHFRHQSWPLSDRATIVNIIGEQAEHLAHLFCTIYRPRVLVEAAEREAGPVPCLTS
jgi:hypothetical protein